MLKALKGLTAGLVAWYKGALIKGGYPLIALLMAIESSVLPVPSEAVIPPAAYMAHKGDLHLSLPGIVIAGMLGSWFGATVMYWAARWGGRPLALRYGRFIFITPEKVQGAERWAAHYGSMGIFISRLLPVVRHLIGIPAGIVRMNYGKYSLYTLLGSGIWCSVLCYIGIKAGEDKELMDGDMKKLTLWLGTAVLALGGLYYFFVHKHMKGSPKSQSQSPESAAQSSKSERS